jgi:hypothetical protein
MGLLNTSTLCIWDDGTIVMLCFYGDLMRIFILLRICYNSPSRSTSRTWGVSLGVISFMSVH